MTFQSAHWNRNQSVEHPVNPQYVPTTLCASSFAIACYVSGFYLPLPAVASSPRGSAVLPTPASCFPFIVIAISILISTVTFSVFPSWSLTRHTLLLPRVSLAGCFPFLVALAPPLCFKQLCFFIECHLTYSLGLDGA